MYLAEVGTGRIYRRGRGVPGFGLGAMFDNADPAALLAAAKYPSVLHGGQKLARGDALVSPNQRFTLLFQKDDGNVVIYDTGGNPPKRGQPYPMGWRAVRSWGQNKDMVSMQTDGNFLIWPGWASDTNRRNSEAHVQMQDDGNLVVVIDNRAAWSSETDGGNYHPGKNLFTKIGDTVSDVASAAASVAAPVAHLVTSPISAAVHIAQGDNVLSTLANHFKDQVSNIKDVAPMAQAIISFVPGVGAGVNAAIAAGSALAQGQNISDALVSAAKNALPGGPLAAAAFDTAYKLGKAAATGGNIGDAALEAARAQVPGGPVAQQAFDTALAIAHGQNVQQAIASGAVNLAKSQISNVASSIVPSLPSIPALPSSITNAASTVVNAYNSLPPQAKSVANSLVNNPALRGMATAQAAKTLGTDVNTLNQAVAALTGLNTATAAHAAAGVIPLFKPTTPATAAVSAAKSVISLKPAVAVASKIVAPAAAPKVATVTPITAARAVVPAKVVTTTRRYAPYRRA